MATDWGKKDPDEVITYGIEYSGALADGDSLSSVVFTFLNAAGCTKSAEAVVGTKAQVRISGGTADQTMSIQCRVTTATGEILEDNAKLKIRDTV